jgi:GT2 family glycosyltransferase
MTKGGVPQVSVVVPHAGNLQYLARCLDSAMNERSVLEVILVMSDGFPASAELAQATSGVRVVVTSELMGYGRAANKGAADARGSLVFILNDDTIVCRGAIDGLSAFMSANPDVAACAPPLVFPDGSAQPNIFADVGVISALEATVAPLLQGPLKLVRRHPRPEFPDRPTDVDWLSGAALVVRRADFDAVGGFDEGFAHGLEDADLCRRLRREGRRVVAVPGPAVVHAKGTSGYRSGDPERVSHALVAGLSGWCWYSRRYHGRIRRRLQQAVLLAFVGLRLAYFETRARLGRQDFSAVLTAYRSAGERLIHDAW